MTREITADEKALAAVMAGINYGTEYGTDSQHAEPDYAHLQNLPAINKEALPEVVKAHAAYDEYARTHTDNETLREYFVNGFCAAASSLPSKEEGEPVGWIDCAVHPLVKGTEQSWEGSELATGYFLAALQYNDARRKGGPFWWIRLCVLEETGLHVVDDDENVPAGWSVFDVTHFMPVADPDKRSLNLNPSLTLILKKK
jgi:hypothetical protein